MVAWLERVEDWWTDRWWWLRHRAEFLIVWGTLSLLTSIVMSSAA